MSEYMITGIGRRIKEIRLGMKKKLTVLAEEADISKGLLSKIENGRTVPSLPVLLSLIKALGISPELFFSKLHYEQPRKYIHKSAEEFMSIKKEEEAKGFNYQLILEKGLENFAIEVVMLEIEPNSDREKVSVDAYELKYVIEGNIDYQIEDEIIPLKKGDTLLYDGNLLHVPHNRSDQTAKMLVVYFYYNPDSKK